MSQCPWAMTVTNVYHISSPLPLDETGRLEGAGIGYVAFPPSAKVLWKSFPPVNRSLLRWMLWALFQNCYLLSLRPETWGFCLYSSARQLCGVPGGKTQGSARFLMTEALKSFSLTLFYIPYPYIYQNYCLSVPLIHSSTGFCFRKASLFILCFSRYPETLALQISGCSLPWNLNSLMGPRKVINF